MRWIILICFLVFSLAQIRAQSSPGGLSGIVSTAEGEAIPGASIQLINTPLGTASNSQGRFLLQDIPAGDYQLRVSFVGYASRLLAVAINSREVTEIAVALEENTLALDGLVVTAQMRSQIAQDVPIALTNRDGDFLKETNIYEFNALADYIPGLQVQLQSPNNPGFVVRGITSDNGDSRIEPRVSVFQDGVSISKSRGSVVELFDMERVEVLKGPQGTLFGRGAQIGAVHLIQNKPQRVFDAELKLGLGNLNQRLATGHLNVPVIRDTFLVRVAGIINQRKGYIPNLSGGDLNGKDTKAVRTSLRYLPSSRTTIDLIVNYQRDSPSGTSFKSGTYAPAGGSTDPFTFADLERGEDLLIDRTVWGTTLLVNHTLETHLDFTSITAYRAFDAYESLDADGTVAPALWFFERALGKQFSQELRFSYQNVNRFSGFGGLNFFWEDGSQQFGLETDERSLYTLFTPAIRGAIRSSNVANVEQVLARIPEVPLVTAEGEPNLVPALPDVPEVFSVLAGLPLNPSHREGQTNFGKNYAVEVFADGTYALHDKLKLTFGLRGTYENITGAIESQDSESFGGLSFVLRNPPNNLFPPSRGRVSRNQAFLSMVGRLAANFEASSAWNFFATVSRGRRPNVIQVLGQEVSVLNDEIVWSYEAGYKFLAPTSWLQWDMSGYYYDYRDFQTQVASLSEDGLVFETRDVGNATAYGLESSVQAIASRQLMVFANYAFINASFDKRDIDGREQTLAGNTFRLTPRHSGAIGLYMNWPVLNVGNWFIRPSYTYQSLVYFEEENQPTIKQSGYGLLNVRTGLSTQNQQWEIALYVSNTLNERYLIDAGNTALAFGIPTFIAGPPRLFGFQLRAKMIK